MSISFARPVKQGKAQAPTCPGISTARHSPAIGYGNRFSDQRPGSQLLWAGGFGGNDLELIHPGENPEPGNAAVISPARPGRRRVVLGWEGVPVFCHRRRPCAFAPRHELDWRLFNYLAEQYGTIGWGRVVSGMGITNIFRFLKDVEHMEPPVFPWNILRHPPSAGRRRQAAPSASRR